MSIPLTGQSTIGDIKRRADNSNILAFPLAFPSDRGSGKFAAPFELYRAWLDECRASSAAAKNRVLVPSSMGAAATSDYSFRGGTDPNKRRKAPKLDPAPGAPEPTPDDFIDKFGNVPRIFIYRNADGSVHSVAARFDYGEKKVVLPYFWGEGPRVAPHWVNQRHPSPVLYRLPEVLAGVRAGKIIVILEGEKDVEGAVAGGYEERRDVVFTTTPGGALTSGKWVAWGDVDYSPLSGAKIYMVPDPDESGRKYCAGIGTILTRMNGLSKPPAVRVGIIPEGWYNGYGKPWGFGDKRPPQATDADIEKVLTEGVPFEEWNGKTTDAKRAAKLRREAAERLMDLDPFEYESRLDEEVKALEAEGIHIKPAKLDALVKAAIKAEKEAQSQTENCPIIKRLNEKHAVVLLNGQTVIMNHIEKGKFSYSRKQDFLDWYANRSVPLGKYDVPLGVYWFEHGERRQYAGVEFAITNLPPGFFNLWEGFAVQATESGKCNLFFEYIHDVICSGDAGPTSPIRRLWAVESGFFQEKALINQCRYLQKRLQCRPTPLPTE